MIQLSSNEVEQSRYEKFMIKHNHPKHVKVHITYSYICNSIVLECVKCKKSKNITDYKVW